MAMTRISQTDTIHLTPTCGSSLSKAYRPGQEEPSTPKNQFLWARLAKGIYRLAIALTLLSPLAVVDLSHAAGRVFYDGFEDGTINAWQQYDYNKCEVVSSAADRVLGPYAGTRMARCNWSDLEQYEQNLVVDTSNYTDELFIRVRIRIDQNNTVWTKFLRIFYTSGVYHDLFGSTGDNSGAPAVKNECAMSGLPTINCNTYWGDKPGDNTRSTSSWHKIEYYIRQSTGTIKVWHDGIQVRNDNGYDFQGVKWSPLYITSNPDGSTVVDSTNYMYFDEFEVYSDRGIGATGLMSDATISSGSGNQTVPNVPLNAQVTP